MEVRVVLKYGVLRWMPTTKRYICFFTVVLHLLYIPLDGNSERLYLLYRGHVHICTVNTICDRNYIAMNSYVVDVKYVFVKVSAVMYINKIIKHVCGLCNPRIYRVLTSCPLIEE